MKKERSRMAWGKGIGRRSFLRGAGSVALGLPFLEEMTKGDRGSLLPRAVAGGQAARDVPERLVTAFFGLGIKKPFLDQRWEGPLEPFKKYEDRMALFTNAQMQQAGGGGAHCESAPVVFVGEKKVNNERAGGASIDQLLKRGLHPDGVPTPIDTLVNGIWFRNGACTSQKLRVWNADGSERAPTRAPSKVFDRLFGSVLPDPGQPIDPQVIQDLRVKHSVMDSVLDQYKKLSGESSYLGHGSRIKLQNHFDSLREVEAQLPDVDSLLDGTAPQTSCTPPERPVDPDVMDYDRFTYEIADKAPAMSLEDFNTIYRMHAALWAMALRCDRVRFGNLMHFGAGDHLKISGSHAALGETLNFKDGITEGTPHFSWFHKGDAQNQARARLHQHWSLTNLTHFFDLLDDPAFPEENGKTVLDNTLIVVGTEYGFNHQVTNVFHALVGGHGHFQPGFYDMKMNVTDIYNAALKPYGVNANVGAKSNITQDVLGEIPGLLA